MTDKTWTEVDDYLTAALLAPDPVLDQALADSTAAGLPQKSRYHASPRAGASTCHTRRQVRVPLSSPSPAGARTRSSP